MTFFSKRADAFETAIEQANNPTQQKANPPKLQDFMEAEERILSEVQARLIKANYYRLILDQNLFGDAEDAIAYEVEQEFREFAVERLSILMGLKTAPALAVESRFSPEQEEALAEWANRLINKPHLLGVGNAQAQLQQVKVQPTQQPPTPPKLTPVVTQQYQQVQQRKRGRPPGTGKYQKQSSVELATPTAVKTEEVLPEGIKVDEKGNKYFEQLDPVTNYMVKMFVNGQPPPVDDPNYKKMPTEDQAIQLGMMQGADIQAKMTNSSPMMGQLFNKLLKG